MHRRLTLRDKPYTDMVLTLLVVLLFTVNHQQSNQRLIRLNIMFAMEDNMQEGDIITDGSAQFVIRKKSLYERIEELENAVQALAEQVVKRVNNKAPDDNGNVTINDISGNAATASNIQATGNSLGILLWDWFHRYGNNYVPADTSNKGWNALGLCIIYYTQSNMFKNQPSQYGQLVNIPADKGSEARQIWIPQYNGTLLQRGGNAATSMNDMAFSAV